MSADLMRRSEVASLPSSPVISRNLAALEGGCVLDLDGVSLPDGTRVLRAGHPVHQTANGRWQPADIVDGVKYGDFRTASGGAVGVLLNDVSLGVPAASVMLAGVVNADASPYSYNDFLYALDYKKDANGIVFVGVDACRP